MKGFKSNHIHDNSYCQTLTRAFKLDIVLHFFDSLDDVMRLSIQYRNQLSYHIC